MKRSAAPLVLFLLYTLALQGAEKNASKETQIARALSAAPRSIAAQAAVVAMDEHGNTTELRPGDNGWTCLPNDPGTPLGHPLCLDKNGFAWMKDAMAGRIPAADKTGYSYMLQGGTSWSNLDVGALQLPSGQTRYISIPPHIMVMNAKIAQDSGFPSGELYPDTGKPFVMYGGTPYAIIIFPLPSEKNSKSKRE